MRPLARDGWSFPGTFWVANVAELFERAAYYGMFIALTLYLTDVVGFSDVATGFVAAGFTTGLYLLPSFMGAFADRIGFRRALLLAFALLTVGYTLLGVAGRTAPAVVVPKLVAVVALAVVMLGGAIVKPVISGTVAKCSDAERRARAFSIFYFVVNIGGFTGKTVAKPLRTGFTVPGTDVHVQLGLEYINYYAAAMALLALLFVAVCYRNVDRPNAAKTVDEILAGLLKAVTNFRFMALILIVAGFWCIQGQIYSTIPKYILRQVGPDAAPEWLANINPAVVVLLVVPITHLVQRVRPENSIAIALFLVTAAAACITLSPLVESAGGRSVSLFGGRIQAHPVTLVAIGGIGLLGLAECFLSPKFLEYASRQAPPGEEGTYMGYQYLASACAWFVGPSLSGFLLKAYCPDPKGLAPAAQAQWEAAIASGGALPSVYVQAHYIWYVFAGIGLAAFAALLVFKVITGRIDRARVRAA